MNPPDQYPEEPDDVSSVWEIGCFGFILVVIFVFNIVWSLR